MKAWLVLAISATLASPSFAQPRDPAQWRLLDNPLGRQPCSGAFRHPSHYKLIEECRLLEFDKILVTAVDREANCYREARLHIDVARYEDPNVRRVCRDALQQQEAEELKRGIRVATQEEWESERKRDLKRRQDDAVKRYELSRDCRQPRYNDDGHFVECLDNAPRGDRVKGGPKGTSITELIPFPPGSKELKEYEQEQARKAKAKKDQERRDSQQQQAAREKSASTSKPSTEGPHNISFSIQGSAFVVQGSNQASRPKNCNISYTLNYKEFGKDGSRRFSQAFVLYGNWSGVVHNQQTSYAGSTLSATNVEWSCA